MKYAEIMFDIVHFLETFKTKIKMNYRKAKFLIRKGLHKFCDAQKFQIPLSTTNTCTHNPPLFALGLPLLLEEPVDCLLIGGQPLLLPLSDQLLSPLVCILLVLRTKNLVQH